MTSIARISKRSSANILSAIAATAATLASRTYSTGGKQKLLGISKRGNTYLRTLFIHGARAVLQQRAKQTSGLKAWLAQLSARTHPNVAVVALANKLARIAWAVLANNEVYRPLVLIGSATA
jgi:transposase